MYSTTAKSVSNQSMYRRSLHEPLRKGNEMDFHFERVYAGHWQRSAGAWSWYMCYPAPGGGVQEIGSQWSVTELLRSKKPWDVGLEGGIRKTLTIIPDLTKD